MHRVPSEARSELRGPVVGTPGVCLRRRFILLLSGLHTHNQFLSCSDFPCFSIRLLSFRCFIFQPSPLPPPQHSPSSGDRCPPPRVYSPILELPGVGDPGVSSSLKTFSILVAATPPKAVFKLLLYIFYLPIERILFSFHFGRTLKGWDHLFPSPLPSLHSWSG